MQNHRITNCSHGSGSSRLQAPGSRALAAYHEEPLSGGPQPAVTQITGRLTPSSGIEVHIDKHVHTYTEININLKNHILSYFMSSTQHEIFSVAYISSNFLVLRSIFTSINIYCKFCLTICNGKVISHFERFNTHKTYVFPFSQHFLSNAYFQFLLISMIQTENFYLLRFLVKF